MIKLLRHIRRSMINKNQTKKYLLYALGEILLVVIGILIALQINNWNEDQKAKKREKDIINDFVTALNNDLEVSINPMIETLERRYAYSDSLIKIFSKKNTLQESELKYFRALMFSISFKWEVTAYENFKAEGAGIIRNKAKRNALIEIYNKSYLNLEEYKNNYMTNLIEYYRPYMRTHFYFDFGKDSITNYMPLDIESLYSDPIFHNTLVTARLNFKSILNEARITKSKVVNTLKLLEE